MKIPLYSSRGVLSIDTVSSARKLDGNTTHLILLLQESLVIVGDEGT